MLSFRSRTSKVVSIAVKALSLSSRSNASTTGGTGTLRVWCVLGVDQTSLEPTTVTLSAMTSLSRHGVDPLDLERG